MTDSIKKTLQVTDYRRQKQLDYNRQYNITPRSVSRAIEESLAINYKAREIGIGVNSLLFTLDYPRPFSILPT